MLTAELIPCYRVFGSGSRRDDVQSGDYDIVVGVLEPEQFGTGPMGLGFG